MYAYLSIQFDQNHSKYIGRDELQKIFSEFKNVFIKSDVCWLYQPGNFNIIIQGINWNKHGNYAFNDDSIFMEINLIEINIPQGAESKFEPEIRELATNIAEKLNWQIDWHE